MTLSESQRDLEELRAVLLASERQELNELRERVAHLEQLILDQQVQADDVGPVLVDAVEGTPRPRGHLGSALQPEIEFAVAQSARDDSSVLAQALYPVMGPAIRKMIAAMLPFGPDDTVEAFSVQQLLLIERESGVLLVAQGEGQDLEQADVVSGMLDAIRLFVNEAFDTPEHDGLRDLRVGDTTVLIEWGPRAVLASVVQGTPPVQYRAKAAVTLERIHEELHDELLGFDGRLEPLEPARPIMRDLDLAVVQEMQPQPEPTKWVPIIAFVVMLLIIFGLIIWLIANR